MLFKTLAVAWPILSVAMWFVGNDFLSVWFAILATFTIGALLREWLERRKTRRP